LSDHPGCRSIQVVGAFRSSIILVPPVGFRIQLCECKKVKSELASDVTHHKKSQRTHTKYKNLSISRPARTKKAVIRARTTEKRQMRVLCLHGSSQCGHSYYTQLHVLEQKLRELHGIELVFCDSPILATTPTPSQSHQGASTSNSNGDGQTTTTKRLLSLPQSVSSSTDNNNNRDDEKGDNRQEACDENGNAHADGQKTNGTTTNDDQTQTALPLVDSTMAALRLKKPTDDGEELQMTITPSSASTRPAQPFMDRRFFRKWFDAEPVLRTQRRRIVSPPVNTNRNDVAAETRRERKGEKDDAKDDRDSEGEGVNEGNDEEGEAVLADFIGLDASLFHIQQVWNRQRDSHPFCGILALEQGAAMAGIICALKQQSTSSSPSNTNRSSRYATDPWFFHGLRFAILISGYALDPEPSILCRRENDEEANGECTDHEEKDDTENQDPEMPGPTETLQGPIDDASDNTNDDVDVDGAAEGGIESLHIIGVAHNNGVGATQSLDLARRYFDQPRIYQHKARPLPTLTTQPTSNYDDDAASASHPLLFVPTRPKDLNVLGKFLVQQKTNWINHEMGGRRNALEVRVLQHELAQLEQQASELMLRNINLMEDTPNSLMAVISPQAVGGWMGASRGPDPSTGGGAPCPKEFLLRKTERQRGDGENKQHPTQARTCSQGDGTSKDQVQGDGNKIPSNCETGAKRIIHERRAALSGTSPHSSGNDDEFELANRNHPSSEK
jgi:hypothetical protein